MKQVGWSSILVGAVLLAVALIAEAQQPKKVPRIGYLASSEPQLLTPPVPRQFGWLCASLAT